MTGTAVSAGRWLYVAGHRMDSEEAFFVRISSCGRAGFKMLIWQSLLPAPSPQRCLLASNNHQTSNTPPKNATMYIHIHTHCTGSCIIEKKRKVKTHWQQILWILFPLMAAGQPKFLHIIHCYSHRCFCSALRKGEKEKKVFYRSTNSSTCPVANGENMSMWIIVLSPWIKISLSAFKIPLTETTAKSIRYLACYAGIK